MTDEPDDDELKRRIEAKLLGYDLPKWPVVEVRPSRFKRLTPEEAKEKRRRERERMKDGGRG